MAAPLGMIFPPSGYNATQCFCMLLLSAFELLSLGYAFKLLQTSLEVVPNAMLRLKYMFTFNRISISGQSFYRTKFRYCD